MQSIIIKNKNVRFEPGDPQSLTGDDGGDGASERERATATARCEKSIRLMESDGVVRAIELSCSCGEVTLIELELAETPNAETPNAETPNAEPQCAETPSAEPQGADVPSEEAS